MHILKSLAVGLTALFLLAGCAQGGSDSTGVGPGDPGGPGGPGGGPTDLTNCSVPASSLCVLGGDNHGAGLVELLLDPQGPLGPIAGQLETDDLVDALVTLLENDGDLASLLTNLLVNGQLQEGLELLLLGDENGEGGLADILQALLLGGPDGGGLEGLLGESGMQGLIMALLVDPADPSCQVPLGTVCLITGDGNQIGLINLLITEDGALTAISDNLSQDELVAILANMLASDGSLANLVENLFLEGQLEDGLVALLVGDMDNPDPTAGGLIQALEGILDPSTIDGLIDFITGLGGEGSPLDALIEALSGLAGDGNGGDGGPTGTPLDDIIAALQGLADGGDGGDGGLPFGPDDLGPLADLLGLLDPSQLDQLTDLLGGDGGNGGPTGTPLDDLIDLLTGLADAGGGDGAGDLPFGPEQLGPLADVLEMLDPEQLGGLSGLLEDLLGDLLGGLLP